MKLFALALLMMLLVAPIGQVVYAQDTGTGDGTDGTGDDGTGDDGTGDDGTGDEAGEEPEDDSQIDPIIYEQIKLQAENRYMELYLQIFGSPETTSDDDGDDGTGDDGTGDDGTGDDGTGDGTEGDELPVYEGPVIPEDVDPALRNQFIHAWSAMQQADEMEESNPRAAANQYLRAMKQLRNAYKKYQKDNPDVVEELAPETEGEGAPEGDVPEVPTDEELSDVQEQLVERFQERFQERVTEMFENYNEVEGDLLPGDAVKAFSALTKAEEKLLRIQEKIDAGEFDDALEDLDDTTDEMDDDFDSMEDAGSKQMFNTMNKLEAKITRMVEQAERKAAKGEDTSEEDDLIAQLRGNKDHTKNEFKDTGKPDKDTGKPDKDTGKPDKDTGKPDKPDKPDKPEKD